MKMINVNLEALDGPGAFTHLKNALDKIYPYDETVEIPQRCEELFQQFSAGHKARRSTSAHTSPNASRSRSCLMNRCTGSRIILRRGGAVPAKA